MVGEQRRIPAGQGEPWNQKTLPWPNFDGALVLMRDVVCAGAATLTPQFTPSQFLLISVKSNCCEKYMKKER